MDNPSGTVSITFVSHGNTSSFENCLEKYDEFVEDVERKIEEFNKPEYNEFEKCQNLNEYINNKKNELNECNKPQWLELYLNDSDKIKGFKEKCDKDPKCPNNSASCEEGPVDLLGKTEDSCGGKDDCTEKAEPAKEQLEPKEESSKSQQAVDTETTKTVTAEAQNLPQQNQDHAQGEEQSQERLSLQVTHDTNPSYNFAETQDVKHQSAENPESGKPEQSETRTESLSTLETTPVDETDTSSSEISSAGYSDPNSSSEEVPSSSRGHQINSDASSDNNVAGHQASGKTYEGQNHGNKDITTKTSEDLPYSLEAHTHGENAKDDIVNIKNIGAGTDGASSQSTAVSPVVGDSVNLVSAISGYETHAATPTGHVEHTATRSAGEQAHDVVTDNKGSSHTVTDREGKGDETPYFVTPSGSCVHGKFSDDRNHDQSVTCNSAYHNNTDGDESATNFIGNVGGDTHLSSAEPHRTPLPPQDNSSIVVETGKTVTIGDGNIMIYKKIILMSLIPLAIILLLTFLVKFTPLGNHFTNKKRKKKKDMTAKLQRILQEPSVEKDERTIPFSYSAFEYSSY